MPLLPFVRLEDIVSQLPYLNKADLYQQIGIGFDLVRGQILKLEVLQGYSEPDQPYDAALKENRFADAIALIPEIVADNQSGYDALRAKGVEFIRCRPIVIPATDYLKWEIEVYRHTAAAFESIYWCMRSSLDQIFDDFATRDFMIFDSRMAIIQDYDEQGLIKGGWVTADPTTVLGMITLFSFIKANCRSLSVLKSVKLELSRN